MYPFDVVKLENHSYQVRTKTRAMLLEFDADEDELIFLEIVNIFNSKEASSKDDLLKRLTNKFSFDKAYEVVSNLEDSDLLFYNKYTILSDKNVCIIGDSKVNLTLFEHLSTLPNINCTKISFSEIIDETPFWEGYDLFLVDSTRWNPYYLELINSSCLKFDKPWLMIGGIEKDNISFGPMFHGRESGCYHCLISRMKSQADYPQYWEEYELFLRNNKYSSKQDIETDNNQLISLLASWVVLEVQKFFSDERIIVTWKKYITIDTNTYDLKKHYLLKKPYCEVCNSQLGFKISPWLEPITLTK